MTSFTSRRRLSSSSCAGASGCGPKLIKAVLTVFMLTSSYPALLIDAGSVRIASSSSRWIYPCGGSMAVEGLGDDVTELVLGSQEQMAMELLSNGDWSNTLHGLSERSVRLKRRVRDLKNLYVRFRFRDDSLVQDLEQMGLLLEGMPPVHQPTAASVNPENVILIIHTAFEHLARVAVFLEQARIGENLALNENVSFENYFRQLEDDHDNGLYWLLCALHRVIRSTGSHVSRDVLAEVRRMRVVEVDRNSLRHTRDYLVLRDFEKLLERLSIEFATLRDIRPLI